MGLPSGESRDMHVPDLAKAMGRRDPQEALGWMDQRAGRSRTKQCRRILFSTLDRE